MKKFVFTFITALSLIATPVLAEGGDHSQFHPIVAMRPRPKSPVIPVVLTVASFSAGAAGIALQLAQSDMKGLVYMQATGLLGLVYAVAQCCAAHCMCREQCED